MHDWCSACGAESWKHAKLNHKFVSALTPVFKSLTEKKGE